MSEGTRDGTPLLEVDNVTKYFGTVIAIKDISMRVQAGEVMCVLGDNGAGKSTLIKIISGLHQQTEGQLLVDGQPMTFGSPASECTASSQWAASSAPRVSRPSSL